MNRFDPVWMPLDIHRLITVYLLPLRQEVIPIDPRYDYYVLPQTYSNAIWEYLELTSRSFETLCLYEHGISSEAMPLTRGMVQYYAEVLGDGTNMLGQFLAMASLGQAKRIRDWVTELYLSNHNQITWILDRIRDTYPITDEMFISLYQTELGISWHHFPSGVYRGTLKMFQQYGHRLTINVKLLVQIRPQLEVWRHYLPSIPLVTVGDYLLYLNSPLDHPEVEQLIYSRIDWSQPIDELCIRDCLRALPQKPVLARNLLERIYPLIPTGSRRLERIMAQGHHDHLMVYLCQLLITRPFRPMVLISTLNWGSRKCLPQLKMLLQPLIASGQIPTTRWVRNHLI